ncbi:MAG: hypothetical protein Q9162_007075 [Coniocarpon cinnabarinum]
MEAYPEDYVSSLVPLCVLAGLDVDESAAHQLQVNGPRVGSNNAQIRGSRAKVLKDAFLRVQDSDIGIDEGGTVEKQRIALRFTQAVSLEDLYQSYVNAYRAAAIHLSRSKSEPAGIYGRRSGELARLYKSATDSLRDNQLKHEMANIRNALEDSKYRSRYAVILVGDHSVVNGPELEERVINIRRAARLDEKCLFFLDANIEAPKLQHFAEKVVTTMYPHAVEFYRELTRHARRKRDRGSNPSHNLSRLGWLARYEYKLGIFAEFCNDMEAAARHYNTSMMALFDGQGPVETTSSWSPRFNEARLWSDTTFIRLMRAQIATSATTAAVKSWTRHRDRSRDLLERKAKGVETYGHLTWESRWSRIMSELVRSSPALQSLGTDDQSTQDVKQVMRVFSPTEIRDLQDPQVSQTISPWHFLHHAGYWLRRSVAYTRRRLLFALDIPEEDRVPPGRSPASAVARRNEAYDTYLSLEPHVEWEASQDAKGAQILSIAQDLNQAASDFHAHHQIRFSDSLRLELCEQLMRASQHAQAITVLKPLWERTHWRGEQWRHLLQKLTATLYYCALESRDSCLRLSTLWELSHSLLNSESGIQYSIHSCLKDIGNTQETQVFHVKGGSILSCLEFAFSFPLKPAFVSVPLEAQLTAKYEAHGSCEPICLQSITVHLEGGIASFKIKHAETSSPIKSKHQRLQLQEFHPEITDSKHENTKVATSDLRFEAGQRKDFNVSLHPEDVGICKVDAITATIQEGNAQVKYTLPSANLQRKHAWTLLAVDSAESRTRAKLSQTRTKIDIQPRPSRLSVSFFGLRNVYYTDEEIEFELVVNNEEDESAEVAVEVEALSEATEVPDMRWLGETADENNKQDSGSLSTALGSLLPSRTHSKRVLLEPAKNSCDLIVEARLIYTLPSSDGRKISKVAHADVVIIRPFEASYQIFAEYHEDPWPDYFHIQDEVSGAEISDLEPTDVKCEGITSTWQYRVQITSLAPDTLHMKDISLAARPLKPMAKITSTQEDLPEDGVHLTSSDQHITSFTLEVQKSSIDEQRPVATVPRLRVAWKRVDVAESRVNETEIELPRTSLASSEPRVLARKLDTNEQRTVAIEYIIENPSLHFLTFNVSVESGDDFAFSGPKSRTLQLTPLSRNGVKHSFMPFLPGIQIQPDVRVTDVHFNKALSVIPTGVLRSTVGELTASVEDPG